MGSLELNNIGLKTAELNLDISRNLKIPSLYNSDSYEIDLDYDSAIVRATILNDIALMLIVQNKPVDALQYGENSKAIFESVKSGKGIAKAIDTIKIASGMVSKESRDDK